MTPKATALNPSVLRWARERAGYTVEDIAGKFSKEIETIQQWEAGADHPTYVQLERLAYEIFKRPLAVFFFPEPPIEPDAKEEFRTLPEFVLDGLSPDTRIAIRQGQSRQLSLEALNEGVNPSVHRVFEDCVLTPNLDITVAANNVREYLGVPVSLQASWANTEEALTEWRNRVTDAGVFVFKRSFKQKEISGFCLESPKFPIIVINNSTARSRQIFTIFHELAHLLLSYSAVTVSLDDFIEELKGEAKIIEEYCNAFAAEFLVPKKSLEQFSGNYRNEEFIKHVASYYKVSREVVARRWLQLGKIDKTYYLAKRTQWLEEYRKIRGRKGESGGDYYWTHMSYLGDRYVNLAFSKYYQGAVTAEELADHLGIKEKNLSTFETYALAKGE